MWNKLINKKDEESQKIIGLKANSVDSIYYFKDGKKYYKCKFYYTIDHRFLNERIVAKLLKDINGTILNPKQVFDQVYFSECSEVSSTEFQPVSKIRMHFMNQMKKNL